MPFIDSKPKHDTVGTKGTMTLVLLGQIVSDLPLPLCAPKPININVGFTPQASAFSRI